MVVVKQEAGLVPLQVKLEPGLAPEIKQEERRQQLPQKAAQVKVEEAGWRKLPGRRPAIKRKSAPIAASSEVQWRSEGVPQVLCQQRVFDRRVERLAWMPAQQHSSAPRLAVSSHGGDVALSPPSTGGGPVIPPTTDGWALVVRGKGKGGAVLDLAFQEQGTGSCVLWTAGHDGYVRVHDAERAEPLAALSTRSFGSAPRAGFCCDHWFTCLCVPRSFITSSSTGADRQQQLVLAGCNEGWATALCSNGGGSRGAGEELGVAWRKQWHKTKVTVMARHPSSTHLVVSGSTDGTMRLWDLRAVGGGSSSLPAVGCGALKSWEVGAGVNHACWSPCGSQLLVTASDSRLLLYNEPHSGGGDASKRCEITPHPHRFYQHLTPIRGSWHPSAPLIAIGRYPAKGATSAHEQQRGIDLFTTRNPVKSEIKREQLGEAKFARAGETTRSVPACHWAGRLGTSVSGVQAGGPCFSPDGQLLAAMTGHSVIVYSVAPDTDSLPDATAAKRLSKLAQT